MKNKNFNLLFTGSLISGLGGTIYNFAASLFIMDLTGKAEFMALYFAVANAVMLIAQPFAGTICDSLQKRKVLYISDFIFGITDIMLAVIIFSGISGTWLYVAIWVNGIINALCGAFFAPASQAIIPLVSEEDGLQKRYSQMGTMQNFIGIFGLVFAGAIYGALGFAWVLTINALCVIASAFMEMKIDVVESVIKPNLSKILPQFKEGWNYLVKYKQLVALAISAVLTNIFLVGVISITLPFMMYNVLKINPTVLAMVQIALSLGGITSGVFLSKTKREFKAGRIIPKMFGIYAMVFVLTYLDYILLNQGLINVWIFSAVLIVLYYIFGCALVFAQIPTNSAYAKLVEPNYMARVMALRATLAGAARPVTMYAFGLVVDNFGVHTALLLGAIGMTLSTIFALLNKPLKALE